MYRRADYRRAVSLLQETLRKQPGDTEALFYLGMSHFRLKETKPATEALQQVAAGPAGGFAAEAKKVLERLGEAERAGK